METIIDMFYKVVAQSPERSALYYENKDLSYRDLNIITSNIALELKNLGVKRNTIVAIQFFSSMEMIISMISILKAGGAYLPISPSYPEERVVAILKDSEVHLVITRINDWRSLPSSVDCEIFFIDNYEDYLLPENTKINNENDWNDLAYVIYTSGSTGKPKGVMIEQKNVINLVEGLYEDIYQFYKPHVKVALVAAFVFDASVQQIFASLLLGHTLYIIPEEIRGDGNAFIRYLTNHNIDICDGTPSHLKIMQQSIINTINVKHFIIGGEVLTTRIIEGFYKHFSSTTAKIINIYGITECCVDSSSFLVDRLKRIKGNVVPIGKPLKNSQIYILDENLNACTEGKIGEIYISGAGVGRGYVNLPELTKEKFLPDPFTKMGLIYKTGDMGKYLTDGNIKCIGRSDNQVKIRGYRIEIDEIENQINKYFEEKVNRDEKKEANKAHHIKCSKCFLTNRVTELKFNNEGLCNFCSDYDEYKSYSDRYFSDIRDLEVILKKAKKEKIAEYDCLLLYSGGKDSTYVLYQLKQMGLHILTFTFDNGYISDTAFENIKRTTKQLNVENITMKMENMDQLFLEELKSNSTVCNSCFRILTYLSTKLAYEKKINVIITGLSRGQIYDTKLYNLYKIGICEPEEVEEKLLLYRKMYHSMNDTIASLIGSEYDDDQYFENKYFIDYYRYDGVTTEEINNFIEQKNQGWNRPENTGFCSTNCAINNVGIYMHLKEKKFHNYAKPLGWDFRLGILGYENAESKLEDKFDMKQINEILSKLGYKDIAIIEDFIVVALENDNEDKFLASYFKCKNNYDFTELKEYLKKKLPSYMIPSYFLRVKEMPLSINGKVDIKSLPNPQSEIVSNVVSIKGKKEVKDKVLEIYQNLLCLEELTEIDNFFECGGDSFKANLLVTKLHEAFQIEVPLIEVYENPTIKELVKIISELKKTDIKFDHKRCVLLKKGTSHKNIFMMHDATGNIDTYKYLCTNLCEQFNAFGLRIDDIDSYEPNKVSMEDIASQYIKDMKMIQPDGPYYLLGWSFGGLLAFEIARQLEQKGDKINLLCIIDSETPDCQTWDEEYELLLQKYEQLIKDFDKDKNIINNSDKLYLLKQLQTLVIRIDRNIYIKYIPDFITNIIPKFEDCNNEELNKYTYLITLLVKALKNYKPGKINSDILLFSANFENHRDEDMQWDLYTDGERRIYKLDENHISIVESTKLVDILNRNIELINYEIYNKL